MCFVFVFRWRVPTFFFVDVGLPELSNTRQSPPPCSARLRKLLPPFSLNRLSPRLASIWSPHRRTAHLCRTLPFSQGAPGSVANGTKEGEDSLFRRTPGEPSNPRRILWGFPLITLKLFDNYSFRRSPRPHHPPPSRCYTSVHPYGVDRGRRRADLCSAPLMGAKTFF